MTSEALHEWFSTRSERLDELVAAHTAIGGTGPGRRYRTEQINRALISTLVAEFQAFARDLHDEAVAVFVQQVAGPDTALAPVVRELLTRGRALEKGVPRPDNLAEDFGRLGMRLSRDLRDADERSESRLTRLGSIAKLRNAIAHGDEGTIELLRHNGHSPPW